MSTPEPISERVRLKLASGKYRTEIEVLETALDLLDEFEFAELASLEKIQAGLAELDQGKSLSEEELLTDIVERHKNTIANRRP